MKYYFHHEEHQDHESEKVGRAVPSAPVQQTAA
jgi:hypothetical protein